MGARRRINRYKTDPSGKDFEEVLKKGKRHFLGEPFMVWGGRDYYGGIWLASALPAFGKIPSDAIVFRKVNGKWVKDNQ